MVTARGGGHWAATKRGGSSWGWGPGHPSAMSHLPAAGVWPLIPSPACLGRLPVTTWESPLPSAPTAPRSPRPSSRRAHRPPPQSRMLSWGHLLVPTAPQEPSAILQVCSPPPAPIRDAVLGPPSSPHHGRCEPSAILPGTHRTTPPPRSRMLSWAHLPVPSTVTSLAHHPHLRLARLPQC